MRRAKIHLETPVVQWSWSFFHAASQLLAYSPDDPDATRAKAVALLEIGDYDAVALKAAYRKRCKDAHPDVRVSDDVPDINACRVAFEALSADLDRKASDASYETLGGSAKSTFAVLDVPAAADGFPGEAAATRVRSVSAQTATRRPSPVDPTPAPTSPPIAPSGASAICPPPTRPRRASTRPSSPAVRRRASSTATRASGCATCTNGAARPQTGRASRRARGVRLTRCRRHGR